MSPARTRLGGTAALGLLTGVAVAAMVSACGSSGGISAAGGSVTRVQVSAPADGSVVSSDRVTVRGTVSPTNATVQVLGQPAQVGNGVFSTSVALQAGSNQIDVVASAPGTTPTTTTVTITRRMPASPHPTRPASGQSGGGGSSGASSSGGTQAGGTSCGGGVTAGPNTTCPFAQNVVAAWNQTGGGTVLVYSPVTGQTYAMSCTSSAPHVCTGANNASVYFP